MPPAPRQLQKPLPRLLRNPGLRTLLSTILALLWGSTARLPANPTELDFQRRITPLLEEFCYDCHGEGSKKGGVSLDQYRNHDALRKDLKTWLAVWRNLDSQLMPPSDKPQPSAEQLQILQTWIEQSVFRLNPQNPDPGRVTLRRLNRQEYRNTIRDLTGVDFQVTEQFPADDTGYGFDTIGEVLNLSPLLMEKYVEAAQSIVDSALNPPPGPQTRKLLPLGPPHPLRAEREKMARSFLHQFATQTLRRPPEPAYLERLMRLFQAGDSRPDGGFERGIAEAMTALLASPRFLFRSESQPEPNNPAKTHPIDEYSLASRLSYFLWSSTPDPTLLELARQGNLRTQMRSQMDRMIADPRFEEFGANFVGQWLQTRDVEAIPIQAAAILGVPFEAGEKTFNRQIRRALRRETELFLLHLIRENRPTLELLTARYTFLNESLANFYGISGVSGPKFQKVDLPENSPRAGILTHGSLLVVTSNPTRTSPVKRGLFVLENLLGTPAPPAPPDVPPLENAKKAQPAESMRRLMEIHREKPLCASCHARMDPIGLALENFNALGLFRDRENGKPIDTEGVLITGEKFRNILELSNLLATRRSHDFHRCISEKLLTYAIGRGLEYYDTTTLNQIVRTLEAPGSTFRTLLYAVAESAPFQKRRGDGDPLASGTPR
ncbi:MAG: hypothetical protein RLZZ244_2623 [Verrucomicrobiota bacterium]|jgi:hypothetical protein